ncbi:MAG TPA: DUF432 domain-containing protein [Candidatus Sumerlaeota bacterium]|nr:DUF432 domain-containing protein [Candidatus Sumerlaeota bacterium]
MQQWGTFPIPESRPFFWQVGPRRLWIERTGLEIRIASDLNGEVGSSDSVDLPKPAELQWKRWMLKSPAATAQILPAMPGQNLIVHSKDPLSILPNAQGFFFVRIPVFVEVRLGKTETDLLVSEPTRSLSKTWFGDFSSGELCLSLRTPVLSSLEGEELPAYRAVCPIRVRNTSKTQLAFRRLCVNVNLLRIFQGAHHLWTNEVHMEFVGDYLSSRVENRTDPPSFEKGAKLLTDSRVPADRSLLRKSFDNFMVIENWMKSSLAL